MGLLLSGIYFFTREIYFTSIFFCITASSLAVYIFLFKICKNPLIGIFSVLFLLASKSFISFSTSGLENCLTFLLLAAFFYFYFKKETYDKKSILILSLFSSLLLLNRMDSILLVIPALAYAFFLKRDKNQSIFVYFLFAFIGFLPFLFWETFSFIYYGDLVPNTAHAKIASGVSNTILTFNLH
jgi:arabinofuranosyltransferase